MAELPIAVMVSDGWWTTVQYNERCSECDGRPFKIAVVELPTAFGVQTTRCMACLGTGKRMDFIFDGKKVVTLRKGSQEPKE